MSEWTMKRKSQIEQRLCGVGMAVFFAVFWFWLLTQGAEYIWLGIVVVPFIVLGLWLALTEKDVFWEMEDEEYE